MDVFSKEFKTILLGLVVLWSAGVSLPAMAVEEVEDEIIVTPTTSPFTSSYQGINYDQQNPGDHVTGPSGENAIFGPGNDNGEALGACSTNQIELTHSACKSNAAIQHNGSSCGGPNVIFGVEGTIDLGFAEFDVNLSIDNNQSCDDDNMALNSANAQCDLDKAQKETDCAA